MLIGFDFDNTIVCYDQAITTLAEDLFDLPAEVPRNKLGLRDYLRREGRESDWTAFQGEMYGPGMCHAEPFEGAIEAMLQLAAMGHQFVIVSHRSLRPYAGPPYDLHAAAREWVAQRLQAEGLFADGAVHFLESRDAKLARIADLGCACFVDDLPEILDAPGFPAQTRGIHFEPGSGSAVKHAEGGRFGKPGLGNQRLTLTTWHDLPELISKTA